MILIDVIIATEIVILITAILSPKAITIIKNKFLKITLTIDLSVTNFNSDLKK